MRESALRYLACPRCHGDLMIGAVSAGNATRIENGQLICTACRTEYPVVRCIPRFVASDNYASNFGLEWTLHAQTQFDSHSGLPISRNRFFDETGWSGDLSGQLVLEVGSGSGRFTEPAASTGAFVVSMDYSYAVEANYKSNGDKPNVLIVQGDVYHMPFRPRSFDKLFCFGMLQHTPDVAGAFRALPPMLKPGGALVVDVYKKTFLATALGTKYWVRWLTRRMDPDRLYRFTKRWVDVMWPLCTVIRRVPRIGPSINWRLLVADYSAWGLQGEVLKEWAYLDTFDMLSPRYDSPQTLATLRRWFEDAGMEGVDVRYGHNAVEGRGRVCAG